VIKRKGHRG
jgi:hypothetical protein